MHIISQDFDSPHLFKITHWNSFTTGLVRSRLSFTGVRVGIGNCVYNRSSAIFHQLRFLCGRLVVRDVSCGAARGGAEFVCIAHPARESCLPLWLLCHWHTHQGTPKRLLGMLVVPYVHLGGRR